MTKDSKKVLQMELKKIQWSIERIIREIESEDDSKTSLAKASESEIEKVVEMYFKELKVRRNLKGYLVLRDAVVQGIINIGNVQFGGLGTTYEYLANKYDTDTRVIERIIRNTVKILLQNGNQKILMEIFGDNAKGISNSIFISAIAIEIKNEYY